MAQALRDAVLAGDYAQSARLFAALKRPTAQELRWGGMCQLHLGELMQARRLLLCAVARGNEAARIELATCLRFEGEFAAARGQLDHLDIPLLEPMDAALALREAAVIEQQCGSVIQAARLLDEAWGQAVGAPLAVQSSVAQSIGLIAAHQGLDSRAEAYLRFADEHASPMRRVYIRLARASSAIYLGHLADAHQHLSSAEQHLTHCPLAAALLPYHWGQFFRAQCQPEKARRAYERAVSLARSQQQAETEAFAHLGLVAVATAAGNAALERGSLIRAAALIRTVRARAYLDWRAGAALARQNDATGLNRLRRALAAFQASGCDREVVWVLLHLAEASLSPAAAMLILREAADTHLATGGQQHLAIELSTLPRVQQQLADLDVSAYEQGLVQPPGTAPKVAEVCLLTLGETGLTVNGQRVRLQMRKSVEVLAYLLIHGDTRLGTLQAEVFDGWPQSRSKNYIHQVRSELRRVVPGLSLPYEARTQTYSVQREGIHFTWDSEQLQTALRQAPQAVMLTGNLNVRRFLTESESEWVDNERERMSRWIIRVGLETMDAWYQAGNFPDCLKLAERLLEIEPLDEGLHEFLIRATAQVSGVQVARATYAQSRALFLREVGQVPPSLDGLAGHLRHQQLN
ncbi:BTAD domain-containing putative transcriptional regulator [Deinococcus sp.]|uniref:BTAD domain-containing putative transcriptional regulator n=1 Tax=Deinococcus sp. TaxID=47478 RepID=UPI003B5B7C16